MKNLDEHLAPAGPKRILALDGGGIRGALTLGYLQKIEQELASQHPHIQNFRLCDYFDLIGGTSTGSIIAALLATGKAVGEIKDMYFDLGGKIFAKKYKWWKIFQLSRFLHARYDQRPLEEELHRTFEDITLESKEIKTGLCIVAKRADTNSVWPLINHPNGKYFNSPHGRNKDIPLWQAVRASSAAPTYFLPQEINVGGGMSTAAFVDGGISMANNPALQLLLVATLDGFPFHWQWGEDKLLIVSVGTGMSKWEKLPDKVSKNKLFHWAMQMPDMFMQDASWHNQVILQWLSKSPTAWHIDDETGDLSNDLAGSNNKKTNGLISYLRYNLWLDQATLKSVTGNDYAQDRIDNLVEMSNADNRFELFEIGEKAAAKEVLATHFPVNFKI